MRHAGRASACFDASAEDQGSVQPRPGRARNLADRINEAEQNGWSGEAEGLQVSLTAAQGNSPP